MTYQGTLEGITKPISKSGYLVTLLIDGLPKGLEGKNLEIDIKEFRPHRSKDANALLWVCLGEIAKAIKTDPWSVYLMMLRQYGKYTYIVAKPEAVEAVKRQWRECEVIGDYEVNGQRGVQMLCYYGSSTYNTKEMSVLLDGVISEMESMGLNRPSSSALQRAMKEWERHH